jgi:hypothetical protein
MERRINFAGREVWMRERAWALGGLAVGLAAAWQNAGNDGALVRGLTVALGVPAGLLAMVLWRWAVGARRKA